MVSREQKIKEIRDIVRNNPSLSAKEHIELAQKKDVSIRKTDFLKERRNVLNLPEPSIKKKESSIPIKFRKVKPTKPKRIIQKKLPIKIKPSKIPFEKTKFGRITRRLQKEHGISEKKAIIHARKILKIDKSDYHKINQKDVQILLDITP